MLGLGTVGSSVVKLWKHSIDPKIARITDIVVSDIDKKRDIDLDGITLTTDAYKILNDKKIDIIIELIGGEEPAFDYIKTALANGKAVITANKAVIALYGDKIFDLAKQKQTPIAFEGSVGAGIPIIRTLITSFNANKISKFIGICNGTCNYLLSSMFTSQTTFNKALDDAKKLGFAESDPTYDIDGYDSAYKCSIIATLAFKLSPDYILNKKMFDKIYREGIKNVSLIDMKHADKLGYIIKPVVFGMKLDNKILLATFPALINKNNLISEINGVNNIIQLDSSILGVSNYTGPGAGGDATAASILADLWNIIENKNLDLDFYAGLTNKYDLIDIDNTEFNYFISLNLYDKTYVKNDLIAELVTMAKNNDVNILKSFFSVSQNDDGKSGPTCIILLTNVILGTTIEKLRSVLLEHRYIESCTYLRVID